MGVRRLSRWHTRAFADAACHRHGHTPRSEYHEQTRTGIDNSEDACWSAGGSKHSPCSLVVPGFVYQVVRSRLRGPTPEDGGLGVRVLRALTTSGLFALIYLIALGPILTTAISQPKSYLDHPRYTALLLLALVFVVPAAVAITLHARTARRLYPDLSWRQVFQIYNPTPTAWDFAVNRAGPGYVRVLTKDGNWVGGYAGTESFFTNYPQAREIFVETAWRLTEQGEFDGPVAGSTGQWNSSARKTPQTKGYW